MAGGIDWFRWHHGSVTDPKFGLIAKKAGARLGDVLAVWAWVLESASANVQRGVIGAVDSEALEYLLGLDQGQAYRILDAMTQRGLLGAGGVVVAWEKRQPRRERDDDMSTERVRAFRQKQRQETPGNATERQETPRGEESREEKKEEIARKRAAPVARPPDVGEQVWADWLQLRKAKRAPVTATTLEGARREAERAGMTLEAFLRVWCRRGSQGLEADWLKPAERPPPERKGAEETQRMLAEQARHAEKAVPPPAAVLELAKRMRVQ